MTPASTATAEPEVTDSAARLQGGAEDPPSWSWVRAQFNLAKDYIHLGSSQFIASHPRPVREAIERHRQALDANPVLYVQEHEDALLQVVRKALATYLGRHEPNEIALTGNTTEGLGLLYAGLPLAPGDEVLSTDHEHFSQRDALRGIHERRGVVIREVRLYEGRAAAARADDLVARVLNAVTRRTRLIALAWVHSDTGLKFPVGRLAAALSEHNCDRPFEEHVRLCVDGTHGFGIETDTANELGCDFLVADTHKWLYGPRGTGFIWGSLDEWQRIRPVVASFSELMDAFSRQEPRPGPMNGNFFTPGGFHAFEHRWAVTEAVEFQNRIGRRRIAARVHELNRRCKQGLAAMPHVILHTPMSDDLSAGIVAFELKNMSTQEARARLLAQRIIATVAPYPSALLRFTPGIYNSAEDIDRGLDAVRALA